MHLHSSSTSNEADPIGRGHIGAPEFQLILRELEHRTANTLTMLHASLRREFAMVNDPALKECLRRHGVLLVSMAELHSFLARYHDQDSVSAEEYFQSLCNALSKSVLAPGGLYCETYVDKGLIPADRCRWLGLIVAELVTNAAKHAFTDKPGGCVRIEVVHRDKRWCCTVSDNGLGIKGTHAGTGSQLIEELIKLLEAETRLGSGDEGTSISIAFDA